MKVRFIILGVLILLTMVTCYVHENYTDARMGECLADGGDWNEETKECNYEFKK